MSNVQENIENEQRYDGVYVGTVVAVDSTGQGRVKANVPSLLEGDDLPWLGFAKASPFGQGAGFGVFGTPALGSKVNIEFQNGDLNYGFVSGFFTMGEDAPEEFRNPHTWGYRDPNGTQLVVNTETKDYTFTHASGNIVSIDEEGNTEVKDVGGREVKIGKGLSITVVGTALIEAAKAIIDSPETETTGNLKVGGILTATNGFNLGGGSSGAGTMTGDVNHQGGEIRSNGVTVSKHTHAETESETRPPTVGT